MPNPLNLSLATGLQSRTEKVKAEIVSLDEIEEMSLSEVNRAKEQLKKRKQRLQLQIDKQKIEQQSEIMNNMMKFLNKIGEGLDNDASAMDLKFLTDGYNNQLKALNTISRLDSIDGTGKAAMLSIEVRYKEG